MKNFFQGQTVRITARFYDFDDVLTNPTVVTAYTMREGDEVWTDQSASIVHDSTGIYHVDIATSAESGVWNWRIKGTGSSANATQGQFYVLPLSPPETDPGL